MARIFRRFVGTRATGGVSEQEDLKIWRKYQEEMIAAGVPRNGVRKRDYLAGLQDGRNNALADKILQQAKAFNKTHQTLQTKFTELMADKLQAERDLVEAQQTIARLLGVEK